MSSDNHRAGLAHDLMKLPNRTNGVDGRGEKSGQRSFIPVIKCVGCVDRQQDRPGFRQGNQE
jgi:hypothetical protein